MTSKPAGSQLISATDDGKQFDEEDAQLVLDRGQSPPRFYIMKLPRRGLTFDRITFHRDVTQCLGGHAFAEECTHSFAIRQRLGLGLGTLHVPAGMSRLQGPPARRYGHPFVAGSFQLEPWYLAVAAPTGSVEEPPTVADLHAFRVSGTCQGAHACKRRCCKAAVSIT